MSQTPPPSTTTPPFDASTKPSAETSHDCFPDLDRPWVLALIAGGQSQRFGQDKATHVLTNGQAWHAHIIEQLTSGTCPPDLFWVTPDKARVPHGFDGEVVADDPAGIGPLGALHAALQHRLQTHGPGWLAVASCDLVAPQAAWLKVLAEAMTEAKAESKAEATSPVVAGNAQQTSTTQAHAAVFTSGGRLHPFPGWCHTDWLPALQQAIAGKQHKLQRLLRGDAVIQCAWPPKMESWVAACGEAVEDGPPQANTPQALADWWAIWQRWQANASD